MRLGQAKPDAFAREDRATRSGYSVDGLGVALGAAAQFAVAVHPGVGALDDPAGAGLNGSGHALAGDLAVKAQLGQ